MQGVERGQDKKIRIVILGVMRTQFVPCENRRMARTSKMIPAVSNREAIFRRRVA